MPTATVDLEELVSRLAERRPGRTEANVQSDLHLLLTVAPLELEDSDVRDIVLESPAGQRRRIDVETGTTVFEVKRDLRSGHVRADAVDQLAGYVRDRVSSMRQRYVGVLTDGAEWNLYYLLDDHLQLVTSHTVDPADPKVDALCVWLEGVLATGSRITPTPQEIVRRLGARSPSHELDRVELTALYGKYKDLPSVQLKRMLWAKLLTTALGTSFTDEDDLFVEHTLLVNTAEILAHAIVGIDPTDPAVGARTLLEGTLFADAQIANVVEADFFDWVAEVGLDGERFVKTLARRLARFDWGRVEHDVMKVLYESVISAETRHSLGEYYTPDWLADEVVAAAVEAPLQQRVLDPGAGSGTFLFHAVRRYLSAADDAGMSNADALTGVAEHVVGVDVHPVAVTLARVTYLLAIGMTRLQATDRPPFTVPVYLGDSVQWGQQQTLFAAEALAVPTDDGAALFGEALRFPDRLLIDAGRFDRLVADLADKAANRIAGSPVPSLTATYRVFAIHPDDQPVLGETFATMCRLHDEGRDHIWGYYVRNLARPVWLSRPSNRVDVLVGNPPWLAYRYMTTAMQTAFRAMSTERGLWGGATASTHQDLSGLFVTRAIELYLKQGGRFGFVLPLAALSRRQFAGFRSGSYSPPHEQITVAFDTAWDLHGVKPSFFPVPPSVVFGRRTFGEVAPLHGAAEQWTGRLPTPNVGRAVAASCVTRNDGVPATPRGAQSPYAARFTAGATVFPRMLLVVEPATASPLGTGAGRRAVRSRRTSLEKIPWRNLPSLSGSVETQFVCPLHVGDTVLPFRCQEPLLAIIPWDGERLLDETTERLDLYPGLAAWWRDSVAVWDAHRSSDRLTLLQRIDYRHGLAQQFPVGSHRVVYSASGMYLAAARINDPHAVIEHKLYWASASSADEALYLTAILNSDTLTQLVRPLQARGEHNPRDFDKYVFQVSIPLFDPVEPAHQRLAELALHAEQVAARLQLQANVAFQSLRRSVRQALVSEGVGVQMEAGVTELLRPSEGR
ncbi:MAG TPA: N-6 DNA methylase [Candidatus Saccharimonadales bacterium]|nr:N-6 DNA methylase [Candidatus Saccharimonadales bacterium]